MCICIKPHSFPVLLLLLLVLLLCPCLQPHMAIVGANAFSHESSMHQDNVHLHETTLISAAVASARWLVLWSVFQA
jgi:hypothetical protein